VKNTSAKSNRYGYIDLTTTSKSNLWWPYLNENVIALTLLLIAVSLTFGALSGGLSTANRKEGDWIDWLPTVNLEYDFIWSELTTGENSLFWNITVNGYDYEPRNIAKFPLYPGIIRGLWELTGRSVSIPLLLWFTHQLMVWAGIAETYRFWERYHRGYGFRAVVWQMLSPLIVLHIWLFGFIEPALIALIWLSLSLEQNRRWAASSTTLLLLTMLQPSGIILACFIGIRRLWRWRQRELPWSAVAWACLPGLLWVMWMSISSARFNQFLAPYTFQADWGRAVFLWPWERWAEHIKSAIEGRFYWTHLITSISLTWISIGYIWGGWLWLKLTSDLKYLFAGSWTLPLLSFLIVLLPLSTAVYGANRYASITLLGIWPLLFRGEIQSKPYFRRFEQGVWMVFLGVNLFVSFTLITDYGVEWGVYYWP